MSGWAIPQSEITFKGTGRTAVVRDAPNVYAIFGTDDLAPYLDDFTTGSISDASVGLRITEEIVRAQMVRPRIASRGEDIPDDQDPEDPEVVPYDALDPSEVDELLERWSKAAERAARFREGHARPRSGKGGSGVGGKAKRPARPAAGDS